MLIMCYKYVKVREITFTSDRSEAGVKYYTVNIAQVDDKLRGRNRYECIDPFLLCICVSFYSSRSTLFIE